jgi:hypothetical protein
MNYSEAKILVIDHILREIHDMFILTYPDMFIKCNTTDQLVYKQANGCMYKWYLATINAVDRLSFSPKYSQTKEEIIRNDWSCVQRFYDDMLCCENFVRFIIENVEI